MPSRLSDAFRSHPVNLTHKQPDFSSLKELPESYAWTQPDEYSSSREVLCSEESVPIVDLKDPNAMKLIGHACKTWGVFQVTNHGIPIKLLEDIESVGQSLFSLPAQQKLKAARSPDGVCGYGLARISSFFSKLMWSEGFTIVGSPHEHFRQLWPQDYCNYWYSPHAHAHAHVHVIVSQYYSINLFFFKYEYNNNNDEKELTRQYG